MIYDNLTLKEISDYYNNLIIDIKFPIIKFIQTHYIVDWNEVGVFHVEQVVKVEILDKELQITSSNGRFRSIIDIEHEWPKFAFQITKRV